MTVDAPKHRHNTLVLSAGRRVELVRQFGAASARLLPGSRVVAADAVPERSASCQIAEVSARLPRVADTDYRAELTALCEDQAIGLIVPTIDTELSTLARMRGALERVGTLACVSDIELVEDCRDKRRTGAVFEAMGVRYPQIYDRRSPSFPCVVKPFDGSSSVDVSIVRTSADLTERMLEDPRMMFMELVGSEFREYTVDAYYDRHGQLKCLVPRERLEVRAGEVSKAITHGGFVFEFLQPRLKRLAGARGCCTFQVFGSPRSGEVIGLEINPRFGGGYPLTAAAGADYAEWLIREYLLGRDIPDFDDWQRNLMMLRYDAEVLVHGGD